MIVDDIRLIKVAFRTAHDDAEYRAILSMICDELDNSGCVAFLVKDGARFDMPAHDLRKTYAPYLAEYGILNAIDWNLRGYAKYQGAFIYVAADIIEKVQRKLVQQSKSDTGGRPNHPAKEWYENQGCERNGRYMKVLQREMEQACGDAPGASTIREWEKEYKKRRNPPTESPC